MPASIIRQPLSRLDTASRNDSAFVTKFSTNGAVSLLRLGNDNC